MQRLRDQAMNLMLAGAIMGGVALPHLAASDVPGCSMYDACSGDQGYPWVLHSCHIKFNGCWRIERQYCEGTSPPVFRYRDSAWNMYPCSTEACVAGARCVAPGGPGGGD